MGMMRSPRESVYYEQREGPGTVEHFIAVEWRMSLQTQQRSRRKNRTGLRHWSQDKRVFLEGRSGQQHQLHWENDPKKSVEFGFTEDMSDFLRGAQQSDGNQPGTGWVEGGSEYRRQVREVWLFQSEGDRFKRMDAGLRTLGFICFCLKGALS